MFRIAYTGDGYLVDVHTPYQNLRFHQILGCRWVLLLLAIGPIRIQPWGEWYTSYGGWCGLLGGIFHQYNDFFGLDTGYFHHISTSFFQSHEGRTKGTSLIPNDPVGNSSICWNKTVESHVPNVRSVLVEQANGRYLRRTVNIIRILRNQIHQLLWPSMCPRKKRKQSQNYLRHSFPERESCSTVETTLILFHDLTTRTPNY